MTAAPSLTSETEAHSFTKWAGGKRKLVPLLLDLPPVRAFFANPSPIKVYHEPFVGGGALFWALSSFQTRALGPAFAPRWASLGDSNPELVNAYVIVRDHVEALIAALLRHVYTQDHYYDTRALRPVDLSAVDRAARFIFLNKTCFNGLYRVNQSGHFNVPFGKYDNPLICDAPNLRACSRALQGVEVHERAFELVLHDARPGDLVYCDPPYMPLSKTSAFTAYGIDGFRLEDHERLRDVALDLKERGVHVVVSNSTAPEIVELYSGDDFQVQRISALRAINSKAAGRGKIEELVIT